MLVEKCSRRQGKAPGLSVVRWAWIGLLVAAACSASEGTNAPSENAIEIRQTKEPFSSVAAERIIPVRVINCVSSNAETYNIDLGPLQHSIEEANEVFKPSGIQFFVSKIERYVMPTFAVLEEANSFQWSQVRAELKLPFPNLSDTTWPNADSKNEHVWIRRVATVAGASHELLYWVFKDIRDATGGQFHFGTAPDTDAGGRAAVHIIGNAAGAGPLPRYIFAHEVGHTLGLGHTFQEPEWRDPKDAIPRTPSDAWDLVYTPGNPDTFYFSRGNAEVAESQHKPFATIDTNTNCSVTNNTTGFMQCIVNGTTYTTGTPAMVGMSLQFQINPARYGPNVMSYIGGEPGTTYSKGISNSQIQLLRRYMRYEEPLTPGAVSQIAPPAGTTLNSDRPNLGTYQVSRAGPYPLDFDGDGKRDLAVWDPPEALGPPNGMIKGTVRINTSRSGFFPEWTASFGLLGDVPFPGDLNGDGCTDIAFWRTSGPTGTDPAATEGNFVWCPSTKNGSTCNPPNCNTSTKTSTFGLRGDIPISIPRYLNAGGIIVVFRPSDGNFYWRPFVSGGANGGFPGPSTVKGFGGSRYGSVPLVGDYDGDVKFDPTIYNPDTATFEILRSAASFAKWTRTFPSKLIPKNSPDPANPLSVVDRAGGFPLDGVGIFVFSRPSVYFPQDGTWNTMWDVANSSPVVSCTRGGDDWLPISSIDRDGDSYTDMVTFAPVGNALDGQLVFQNSHNGDCSGTTKTVVIPGGGGSKFLDGIRPFGAADMTGDGKNDVVLLNPNTATFFILKSESDYAFGSAIIVQIGTQKSVPL